MEKENKIKNRPPGHGPAQTGVMCLLPTHRAQYRSFLLHGPAQAMIYVYETFFTTYMWHMCVIFCNFGGNFDNLPAEAIAPLLLLGIDYFL